jgi:two-component SAPR family response regulator
MVRMASTASRNAEVASGSAKAVVAVVDDDMAVRTLVERVLTAYDVRTFDRPQAALRAFGDGLRPQLIVSDVQMPGMSGFELHAEVRRMAPLRGVPFVYLTAMDDHDSLRRGMGQGADDYLTKPFTPAELREAVAVRLARHVALTSGAPTRLEITTLGGLALALGGERLSWEARKVVMLLAYLLDHGESVHVDSVRRDLWAGPVADNHLHVLVSRLRKTLGEHGRAGVAEERVWLEITPEVRWDVATFEAAADRADGGGPAEIEAAIAAYGGELLSGFDGPWVDARRAELEARYVDLLEEAAERAPEGPERQRARARFEAFLDLV